MITVLSIGGIDPCGYSGFIADHKTFLSLGVRGVFLTATLTAQNSTRFILSRAVPLDCVAAQLTALKEECQFDAVKTGLLTSPSIIEFIADQFHDQETPIVCDPVFQSTTGRVFLRSDLHDAYEQKLFPICTLITPNLKETALLTGIKLKSESDFKHAARKIKNTGTHAVLIKGGHSDGPALDYLWDGQTFTGFKGERILGKYWRGLGCTLSAAITVYLAQGNSLIDSVAQAKEYITTLLKRSTTAGRKRLLIHPCEYHSNQ